MLERRSAIMIDIVVRGIPRRFFPSLPAIVWQTEEEDGPLEHVRFFVLDNLIEVCRLHNALHTLIRADTSVRMSAAADLQKVRYREDPRCLIPACERPPCKRLCGSDQWSTPHYWQRHPEEPVIEDCDGIEFLVAGLGAGLPLYVEPEGENQGHVLHLTYSSLASDRRVLRAIDYCIPAGMREWTGPRKCFFFRPNGNGLSKVIRGGIMRTGFYNNYVVSI